MLERKVTKDPGKPLPKDWQESVTKLLNETYAKECNARGRQFDVYGQIFPHEFLVVVGLLPIDQLNEGAISCFLSCEGEDLSTPEKVKTTQANYVDIASMMFDEVFADEAWNDWEPQWQEVDWKGQTYWYKMTRENVRLTLEANRLLQEAGHTEELAELDERDEDETNSDQTIH